MLAAQADGAVDHHDRGPGPRRRAAPGAAGVPRAPRAPVRLLHRGHGPGGGRRSSRRTRTRPSARCGSGSRATSAAAPATTTSSTRCSPRRRRSAAPVIPAAFDYVRADSADAAVALLAEHGDEAKLLAGGMSLLPLMKLRLAVPTVLVDVGRLARPLVRARRRRPRRDRRAAPATATSRRATLLARRVRRCCVRSRPRSATTRCGTAGTIGGSVAHGDPASDLPGSAARARRDVRGPGPRRRARDRGRRRSSRASSRRRSRPTSCSPRSGSRRPGPNGFAYQKFNRRAQDWAIVGALAVHGRRRDAASRS